MELRAVRLFVISPDRIYREGLLHVLDHEVGFAVAGSACGVSDACAALAGNRVDVVLLDTGNGGGPQDLRWLAERYGVLIVVLGVREREEDVIAWVEAGVAGYVTPESSLDQLRQTVRDAVAGQFRCPPQVAAMIVRRLAALSGPMVAGARSGRLSRRELEIAQLLVEGLTNKEIGRRLHIQTTTVKNHVHNVLEKLGVSSRLDAAQALRRERPVLVEPPAGRVAVLRRA